MFFEVYFEQQLINHTKLLIMETNSSKESKRTPITELLKKRGIKSEDKTKEMLGTTTIIFTSSGNDKHEKEDYNKIEDETGAVIRYLNMRKGN